MKYKRGNLVVLMFAPNNCWAITVIWKDARVKQEGVTIDHEAGTWTITWGDRSRTWKIGEARHTSNNGGEFSGRDGVIGVYDRTKIQHLSSMVHAAMDTVHSSVYPSEDS